MVSKENKANAIRRCAVYAASSSQVPEAYLSAAAELGAELAGRGIEVVYGAGRVGLMGALADAALERGGRVTGVIPQFMVDNGWQREGLSQLIVTPDMHARKQRIASLADAAIALPGGIGTLEELAEIITWKQLGLFARPVVILNVEGYFAPLLEMLERMVEQRFMRAVHRSLWAVASTAAEAVDMILTLPPWDTSISKMAQL